MSNPGTILYALGAGVASVFGVSYALTRDPIRAVLYGAGFIMGAGTLGYIYTNSKIFNRGKNGLGGCDTADSVIEDAFGKNSKTALEGKVILITGANSGIGF